MATRIDRLAGSPIMSIKYDLALSSSKRLQLIRLSSNAAPRHRYMRAYQEMVWFLTASTRFRVRDITGMIRKLQKRMAWWNWPITCMFDAIMTLRFADSPSSTVLSILNSAGTDFRMIHECVNACLNHPIANDYGAALRNAFDDPKALRLLPQRSSYAERQMEGTFLVLIANIAFSKKLQHTARLHAPSFFTNFPGETNCQSQVHVIDIPVAKQKV